MLAHVLELEYFGADFIIITPANLCRKFRSSLFAVNLSPLPKLSSGAAMELSSLLWVDSTHIFSFTFAKLNRTGSIVVLACMCVSFHGKTLTKASEVLNNEGNNPKSRSGARFFGLLWIEPFLQFVSRSFVRSHFAAAACGSIHYAFHTTTTIIGFLLAMLTLPSCKFEREK